jgi:hypothetical protein
MTRFLYHQPLGQFLSDVAGDRMVEVLVDKFAQSGSGLPSAEEQRSWRESLGALAEVLADPSLASSEIFVELFMPLNNRRCDALLTGRDQLGGTAVVIELKQWSTVAKSHLPDHVVVPGHHVVHPSVQARDYAQTLKHHHSAFTGDGEPIRIFGAAYLHNMGAQAAVHLRDPAVFGALPVEYPLFLKHERAALAQWLAARLVPGPGEAVAQRIRHGRALPSPKLLDLVVQTIEGEHEWRLLDVQKTVFFHVRHAVQLARDQGEKKVIVVRGGPGTGKSVLAIQLLAHGARQHWKVAHATGSKAFQTVLQGRTEAFSRALLMKLHGARYLKQLPVKDLFTTFAAIAKLGTERSDELDLTVCDEAHRLWRHRRLKFPNGKVKWLSDTFMVDEVLAASRVTVFFLDDHQSVRSGEIGRSEDILERARALGLATQVFDLDAQFRCAGSESYIHWVEGLFGLRSGRDLDWFRDEAYALRIWDSMPAMHAFLAAEHARGARARLVAGYCWRWSKPAFPGHLPQDLQDPRFEGWTGAWIEKTGQDLAPLQNQYYLWATRPEAFEQVGSIYSAQGFEFDHVGLIWGEDLVWRSGEWVANLKANKDGAFKKELRSDGGDPVAKLLNVYRVLLTRGMVSTHLFILDEETRTHVRACLAEQRAQLPMAVGAEAPEPASSPPVPPRASAPMRLIDRPARNQSVPALPVIDPLRIAAGVGPDLLGLDDPARVDRWLSWLDAPREPGAFVARVEGTSMEPLIRDGDWCIFRPITVEGVGSRPVLVRLPTAADDGSGGRFSVKHVRVEWGHDESGHLARRALVLTSENPDYRPVRLEAADDGEAPVVIAELLRVLGAELAR